MTEQIKQIAERIRGLREISNTSVEVLAKSMKIPASLLTEYESGKVDIPVSLLYKISHKFDVELSALLSGENPKLHIYCVVRKGKGISVERRKQYGYESLANNFLNKKAEPFLVTVEPEQDGLPVQFNSHPGQEFNYVLEGIMKVNIDEHEVILYTGDSIYFDSSYQHSMKALNNRPVKILAVVI
jgi:mannose-6-phosphate isomerase-like protein (cupin superfamily)